MIGAALLWLAQTPLTFRGKHFFLRTWDRLFGDTVGVSGHGIRLSVRLGSTQDLTFLGNATHDQLASEIHSLRPNSVFIDVGANIGYYTLLASRIVGRSGICIACEPSQREYVRLLHHLELNGAENVLALNVAIGETMCVARMKIAKYHTGLNEVVYANQLRDPHFLEQPCLVVSLDDIVGAVHGTKQVDLLKVDVEGAELTVLQGARGLLTAGLVVKVFVEVTDSFLARHGHSAEQLYGFMLSMGYVPTFGLKQIFQYDEIFVRQNKLAKQDAKRPDSVAC